MEVLRDVGRSLLIFLRVIRKPELVARKASDHPVPEAIEPGNLYVVGKSDYVKWAYFRCPVDVDEIIQLSLMANRHPFWRITIDMLGRPTLYPSVRQLEGSFAHYCVKHGNINFCEDSGRVS